MASLSSPRRWLPVAKFHGVGPATAAKMNRHGIKTGFDLREQTLAFLQQHFGKPGPFYYWMARGVDERPVRADRIRKSLGAENTFSADIFTFEAASEVFQPIIKKVWRTCEGAEILRAHGDTESEIRRFPADRAKPDRSGAVFDASRNRGA